MIGDKLAVPDVEEGETKMKKNLLSVMFITMLICSGCGRATESIDTEVSVKEFTDSDATVMEAQAETLRKESNQELVLSNPSEEEASETEEATEIIEESEVPGKMEASKSLEESAAVEETGSEEKSVEEVKAEQTAQSTNSPTNAKQETPAQSSSPTPHTCTWDSGKETTNATCNSEGTKTYTCTGCGTTRTEGIAKTAHNYITESIPATCTEAGRIKTYCSICGDVQSEVAGEAAKGHIAGAKAYWQGQGPTCRSTAYYNICCSTCGERLESGTDPALPHTEEATELRHGNCIDLTVLSIDCSVCGGHIRKEAHTEPDDHNWVTGTYETLNLETLEYETITVTYCSRCEKKQ